MTTNSIVWCTLGYKPSSVFIYQVVAPFAALKAGADLQRYIDVLVPDSAKFKIISGEGPVTLVGSHCVDFYDYRNYGGEEEEEEDEEDSAENSEDDAEDMEEQVSISLKTSSNERLKF